ncbi:hypothetical protein [uncultured Clostridium sp.]|uniref:hypothetical protein n=1 Tax=uncultured Clostridium sp. TaxID=59620 RepID=UPI0028ECEC90|nr:hypothetical protein [uncultured Clostridium sp.]
MNNESEESHYYKIVKDLDVNLGPYIVMPMYDEHPDLGTFHSTIGVKHPRKGDFIICNGENIWFDSAYRDFEDVSFSKKVNIQDLLTKNIICEVSNEFYNLDIETDKKMLEVARDIERSKMYIDSIKYESDKGLYTEKDLKEEQEKLKILSEKMNELVSKRKELENIDESMNE